MRYWHVIKYWILAILSWYRNFSSGTARRSVLKRLKRLVFRFVIWSVFCNQFKLITIKNMNVDVDRFFDLRPNRTRPTNALPTSWNQSTLLRLRCPERPSLNPARVGRTRTRFIRKRFLIPVIDVIYICTFTGRTRPGQVNACREGGKECRARKRSVRTRHKTRINYYVGFIPLCRLDDLGPNTKCNLTRVSYKKKKTRYYGRGGVVWVAEAAATTTTVAILSTAQAVAVWVSTVFKTLSI